MLPSFENIWANNQFTKPRIQVLEIKHRDRPHTEPMAWLLVERQETYRHDPQDGTLLEASISIFYQRITARYSHQDGGKGHFEGNYSKLNNSVSLTSASTYKGAVFLDLPSLEGQRIGTYLMNEIVRWVQRWPEATVKSVELVSGQAGEDNKERRNRFYEQFGLVFDYTDAEHREGRSRPMLVGELTSVETWKKNIIERRMFDYLADTLYAEQRASSEMAQRNRSCDNIIAERRQAEAKPIRWALKILYYQYGGILAWGVVLTLLVAVVWSNLRA
jgi:GNAT superfamily N-acetyltransferase